jgi:putative glycosyltransferase (TIGR04372 family)
MRCVSRRGSNVSKILATIRRVGPRAALFRAARVAYRWIVWLGLHGILLLLYPFKRVKIVWVQSDGIGHLAYNTDVFLRRHGFGDGEDYSGCYLGIASARPANQQLLEMIQRKFRVVQSDFAYKVLTPLFAIKNSAWFESTWALADSLVPCHSFEERKPLLSFIASEEDRGRRVLSQMGIDSESWFICFQARDAGYLAQKYPKGDWSYHTYRDCNINNYLRAVEYIAEHGGFAVRMGEVVGDRLSNQGSERIVDYASRYRSDFGDTYLPARAKFFLGCTAGLFLVSVIFGVPVALANFIPLEYLTCFRGGDLFIPKKVWSMERKRFLTFREILDTKVGRFLRTEEYTAAHLEVIENTQEEILDLAREMNERLDGAFRGTEEDEELQRRLQALFRPGHYCYGTPVRVGARFLQENRHLLE